MTSVTEHIKEVSRWLDENVATYPTPRAIALSGFEVDWEQMAGCFYLSLDDQRIPEPFRISLAQNGWMQFTPPMFTSPLGAPASYAVVELTEETSTAITKVLHSIFPRLKPMGLDQETGELIGQRTPVSDRIKDQEELNKGRQMISRVGFSTVAYKIT